MEYLLVRFNDEEREFIIDGELRGWTNEVLELEKGTHVIRLKGPPFDFAPPQIRIILEKTTRLSPREVKFEKI
ncbi:MAG: hypothetical protein KJ649_12525 [Proteobacteria bacterium]|nr:hypothetical protein [Pseudomonadota bacterium]MBU1964333.1 hypothetical protein [Pseudomonadota bacterium]